MQARDCAYPAPGSAQPAKQLWSLPSLPPPLPSSPLVFLSVGKPRAQVPTTRHTPSGFCPCRICRTIGLAWPMQSSTSREVTCLLPLTVLLPLLLACAALPLADALGAPAVLLLPLLLGPLLLLLLLPMSRPTPMGCTHRPFSGVLSSILPPIASNFRRACSEGRLSVHQVAASGCMPGAGSIGNVSATPMHK